MNDFLDFFSLVENCEQEYENIYQIQRRLLIAMIPIPMQRAAAVDRHKQLMWALLLRLCERIQRVKMDANVVLVVHLIK